MASKSIPALSLALALVGFASGAVVHRSHAGRPLGEPDSTVRSLFRACASGSLEGVNTASTPQFYNAFVQTFGESKLRRVEAAFSRAFELGQPEWYDARRRAAAGAADAYQALRERVMTLGRAEFATLGTDRRMQLIDEGGVDAFIFDAGIRALPPEQQHMITDRPAFTEGRDVSAFIEARLWQFAPDDDKRALGAAAALSQADTPEKFAFIDRAGIAHLPKAMAAEIAGISRSDLADEAAFKLKHGEPLAREYLKSARIPADVTVTGCRYPREENDGGLLRGVDAACSLTVVTSSGEAADIAVRLAKREARWLVVSIAPAIPSVRW